MTIALPITTAAVDPVPDIRHYTPWTQKKAPAVVDATLANPTPEDPGTVEIANRHFTEWQTKPR